MFIGPSSLPPPSAASRAPHPGRIRMLRRVTRCVDSRRAWLSRVVLCIRTEVVVEAEFAATEVIYTTAGGALANLLHKMTDDEDLCSTSLEPRALSR